MSETLCHKSFPVSVKAVDGEPGVFEAIVSVFGNIDRGGDRVLPGAFKNTLATRGLPPILWSHNFGDPPVGVALDAKETDEGLWIKGALFVDDETNDPYVRRINTGLKRGAIKEFSFAYRIVDSAEIVEDGERVNELKELELWEVSPVVVGMNPATRLVAPPKVAPEAGDAPAETEPAPRAPSLRAVEIVFDGHTEH